MVIETHGKCSIRFHFISLSWEIISFEWSVHEPKNKVLCCLTNGMDWRWTCLQINCVNSFEVTRCSVFVFLTICVCALCVCLIHSAITLGDIIFMKFLFDKTLICKDTNVLYLLMIICVFTLCVLLFLNRKFKKKKTKWYWI